MKEPINPLRYYLERGIEDANALSARTGLAVESISRWKNDRREIEMQNAWTLQNAGVCKMQEWPKYYAEKRAYEIHCKEAEIRQ